MPAHMPTSPHHQPGSPRVLLINPPLWNPYAPHLAVPLLLAVLRQHHVAASALDLSAETMRYLLSSDGAADYAAERDLGLGGRARDQFEAARSSVDRAVAFLRSPLSITDVDGHRAATAICQAVLDGIAALTPGAELSFDRFDLRHRPVSSRQVYRAVADAEHNPYVHVFERVLIPRLRAMPDLEVVGLSVSADSQLIAALTAARLIRRERPDVHITVGGNFVTRIADRLWPGHPFFTLVDSLVCYEGEESIIDLVDRLLTGRPLHGVPGIVVPDGDELHRCPSATASLAELPVPDFTDHPLADGYLAPGPVLPVIASRSCAWKCAFCAIPFASDKFRIRAPEAVVAEMDELHRRHGTGFFQFVDEILTVRSMRALARGLADRDYRWYGETRFSPTIDRRLTDALYTAGCRRLDLGLESYNQDVLDRMRKDIKASWIAPNLDALLASGISVHLFGIAGFPGEARWQTARTVEFAAATLARSRDRYAVPDSTFGIGPFVLDALSPVATAPEQFQVRVLHQDPGDDLQMALRYDYLGPLPEPVSAEDRDIAARADRVLGGAFGDGDRPAEEVVFLRAAARRPGERDDDRDGPRGVPCPGPHWERMLLRPAEGWVVRLVEGERTLLYEPRAGALFSLPSRMLDGLPATAEELCRDAAERELVRSALHHRCLEAAEPGAAGLLTSTAQLTGDLLLRLGPGTELATEGVDVFLTSRVTGQRLRLSASGAAVARLVAAGEGSPWADLAARCAPGSVPRLRTFVWRLLVNRLLSVETPDRSAHPLAERR
ncbi:B12-binding domain-containing radical SAM protein [Actinacidiphila acidipaludis]|uniref:B12-binding domain-containing radical SAM protein n=1 Tax=Actinacidiphila acidipaludis TaxID=2873382 RepID=A0ABS7QGV3_9ACTN|nr:radical SAM protein [Streptomyces acidipaludis]MBY8882031.1 B12-binding domain-containing radical SAM protein [Streptomyces acidipaludis]